MQSKCQRSPLLFIYILCSFALSEALQVIDGSFTESHLNQLKNRTRLLFDHGWNSYKDYGYPADEVRPLSCEKYERVEDVNDIHRNDVLGNYSVTFVDTLTAFAVFNEVDEFTKNLDTLKENSHIMNLDQLDSTVQVFETTIRALGSLLSAHLYAYDKFQLSNYDGFLLDLAKRLGERLLEAYKTKSGIPQARVNLKSGVEQIPTKLVEETCTAGAASPMLELTLLSVLTNDTRFEELSRTAFFTLWNSRSKLDLVPMSINPIRGKWLDAITGIGASIDSFYEYALKGSILFDDDLLYDVWRKSYKALSTYSKNGWFYSNIHVESGFIVNPWIDALSAFFPGLLTLSGHIDDAINSHIPFIKLWNKYGGIPERWDFLSAQRLSFNTEGQDPISLEWYPLRPEFIESTYYLYRATKDPVYLRVGERILKDYETTFKARCGFAGYRDVRTGEMQDRMESFVLSETFMYLYLLFDESNELNNELNYIFSTEGHPLWVPKGILSQYKNYKFHRDGLMKDGTSVDKHEVDENDDVDLESTGDYLVSTVLELFKRNTTVSALLAKMKEWKENEVQVAVDYIKNLFLDSTVASEHEYFSNSLVTHLLLHQEGYELEPTDLDSCPASKSITDRTFFSAFLSNSRTFQIDSVYHTQWNTSQAGPNMEIDPEFYSLYADPTSYCDREPTSIIMEYNFGDMGNTRNVLIEYMKKANDKEGVSKTSDLWLHAIDGVRLKLELLKPGQTDHFNRLIDWKYLMKYYKEGDETGYDPNGVCMAEEEVYANGVFEVRSVNGISVEKNATVYLGAENKDVLLTPGGSVKSTKSGNLMVENVVISNMKFWKHKAYS